MTGLPSLPTNLSTKNVNQTVTTRLPQFPNLPNIRPITQAIEDADNISTSVKSVIPESVVNKIINESRTSEGNIDFDRINTELDNKYETVNEASNKIIGSLQVLATNTALSGILSALLPSIPVPNIPDPGEIRRYINNLIERKKREQQQAIMLSQRLAAQAEELPFTARQAEENNVITKSSCVTTGTGQTVEEAISKAEFSLRRSQKCVGEVTILRSVESDGTYAVTIKID